MYLDAQDGLAVVEGLGSIRLTPREIQLMLALIEHQPHWVSTDYLTTWLQISAPSISMRVRALRRKLAEPYCPQSRWGYGYKVEGWDTKLA